MSRKRDIIIRLWRNDLVFFSFPLPKNIVTNYEALIYYWTMWKFSQLFSFLLLFFLVIFLLFYLTQWSKDGQSGRQWVPFCGLFPSLPQFHYLFSVLYNTIEILEAKLKSAKKNSFSFKLNENQWNSLFQIKFRFFIE